MVQFDHTPAMHHIDDRLRADAIVWLVSVRPDGRPHIVPVWFLWDGDTLLILSQPNTQKVKNIAANPRVSVALDDSKDGSDVIVFEGAAELLSAPASAITPQPYFDKYAAAIARMQWNPEAIMADYSQVIRVRPTRFLTF